MFHTECECGTEIVSFKLKTHCSACEEGLSDVSLGANEHDDPTDLDAFEENPIEG